MLKEESKEEYKPKLLQLLTFPDEFLTRPTSSLPKDRSEEDQKALAKIVIDMTHTMKKAKGIGLAANQVGLDLNLFVMSGDKYFINPKVVERAGEVSIQEGCLSFPQINVKVKRSALVKVSHEDIEGNSMIWEMSGLEAIVAQHEIDHLNGITFYDHASPMRKNIINRKMKKFQREKLKREKKVQELIRSAKIDRDNERIRD